MTQRFQTFSATLRERRDGAGVSIATGLAPTAVFDGRVSATQMAAGREAGATPWQLQVHPAELELTLASGAAARFQGQRFVAAAAGRCL